MATKVEEYMTQMFSYSAVRPDAGFLGAYNMGVFGVSVSGKPPLNQGLSACGTLLEEVPKWMVESEDAPKAANFVKFYDTPSLWGYGDDGEDPWSDVATIQRVQQAMDTKGAWTTLVGRWEAVIAQSTYLVDITSLSPPFTGSEAQVGICRGIASCLERWVVTARRAPEAAPKLMIRLLFGMTATHTAGVMDTEWNNFYYALERTLAPLRDQIVATGASELPVVLYGSDMGRKPANFNHSKIVAGDGHYAVVGGHNMCEEVSSNTAPVIHDITSEVTGPGARSANAFAGSLWLKAAENGRLYIYRFKWDDKKFENLSTKSTKLWAPKNWVAYGLGAQREVPAVIKNQYWFYPMQDLPPKPRIGPPAGSVPATAVMGVGRWGETPVFGVDATSGLKFNTEIQGRFACQYASDVVKRFLINDGRHTVIGMSQQDLMNDGVFGMALSSDHVICEILGKRLKDKRAGLAIHVVVSSRFTQNVEGLAYSYGDGPREAAERISDTANGTAQAPRLRSNVLLPDRLTVLKLSEAVGDADEHPMTSADDPSYCTVAPLTFCEARGTTRDRGSYVWPDAKYKMDKVYPSGRFWNKQDKKDMTFGPGNHAKVLYVSEGDDNTTGLVMLGSDNMYPSPLSEFNFLIEGAEALNAFRTQYWDRLWGYSKRLGFTVDSQGDVT